MSDAGTEGRGLVEKGLIDTKRSPRVNLIPQERVQAAAEELRAHLLKDNLPETRRDLEIPAVKECLETGQWWQRLTFPGTQATTKSDWATHEQANPGFLNTLNGALTPQEGALLRPMPKWVYLEPILPDLRGKSVLDLGCNNGFFSFLFREKGAGKVTGYDVWPGSIKAARAMAKFRGVSNIDFVHRDALLDLSLPKHDIVFMSEVYAHFVDPFFGILRAVNLANELLIIDNAADASSDLRIDLGAGINKSAGTITYTSWMLSDGLMLTFLYLCGVQPERVTRYFGHWGAHIVYVIDTRDVEQFRKAKFANDVNRSFMNMQFVGGES